MDGGVECMRGWRCGIGVGEGVECMSGWRGGVYEGVEVWNRRGWRIFRCVSQSVL